MLYQYDITLMDEHIGPHVQQTDLVIYIAPGMNPGPNSLSSGFFKDFFDGFQIKRMIVLFRNSQVVCQVMGADLDGIELLSDA